MYRGRFVILSLFLILNQLGYSYYPFGQSYFSTNSDEIIYTAAIGDKFSLLLHNFVDESTSVVLTSEAEISSPVIAKDGAIFFLRKNGSRNDLFFILHGRIKQIAKDVLSYDAESIANFAYIVNWEGQRIGKWRYGGELVSVRLNKFYSIHRVRKNSLYFFVRSPIDKLAFTVMKMDRGKKTTCLGYINSFKDAYEPQYDDVTQQFFWVEISNDEAPIIKFADNRRQKDLFTGEGGDLIQNLTISCRYLAIVKNIDRKSGHGLLTIYDLQSMKLVTSVSTWYSDIMGVSGMRTGVGEEFPGVSEEFP